MIECDAERRARAWSRAELSRAASGCWCCWCCCWMESGGFNLRVDHAESSRCNKGRNDLVSFTHVASLHSTYIIKERRKARMLQNIHCTSCQSNKVLLYILPIQYAVSFARVAAVSEHLPQTRACPTCPLPPSTHKQTPAGILGRPPIVLGPSLSQYRHLRASCIRSSSRTSLVGPGLEDLLASP